jgi:tetratricopeptide (TPR) repeat protein
MRASGDDRAQVRRLVVEKLPLFGLCAAAGLATFLVQRSWGAVSDVGEIPLGLRLENVLLAYAGYLRKLVWPADLSVFYPFRTAPPLASVAAAGVLLAAVSWLAIARARRSPFLLVGWCWYLGMLVPVIGLVQVGSQAMADRYTYLPAIGILLAVVWSLPDPTALAPVRRAGAAAAIVLLLGALGAATWAQVGRWRTSVTLFEHALRLDPANYLAHGSLALARVAEGRTSEGIEHYRAALAVNPRFSLALKNLGLALQGDGRADEAVAHYRQALRLRPDDPDVLNNFAWLLATTGRADLRDGAEALRLATRACELTRGSDATMIDTLAAAYAETGRYGEAVQTADRAIATARASGRRDLEPALSERRELYRSGRSYRELPPAR